MLCGGYGEYRELEQSEKELFEQFKTEISARSNGLELNPSEVTTQIVNGTNYRFKADAGGAYYVVVIHKPIQGTPSLTSVTLQPQ